MIEIEEAIRPSGDTATTKLFAYFGGQRYERVKCDCHCGMPCAQRRTGSMSRCWIWTLSESQPGAGGGANVS